jgi:nucleotide-binding universal stress UspA family protein
MNILVPANGSWASYQAERYAIELCKKWGGKIIAIHILHRDSAKGTWRQHMNREIFQKVHSEEDAHAIIDGIKKIAEEAGIEIEAEIKESSRNTSKEIIEYVKAREDIDLIVIGHGTKRGVLSLLFGSNTHGLMREFGRHLKIPVVQVPEKD